MTHARLEGLRAAVELSPDNHALRLVLAESLRAADNGDEALDHYERLLGGGALPPDELTGVGRLAIARGRLQLAARCLDRARRTGVIGGTTELETLLTTALADSGAIRHAVTPGDAHDEDFVTGLDGGFDFDAPAVTGLVDARDRITFQAVGGLDEVKKAVHRTIILPYQRPDLYQRYGRRAGGGVLLYGPPGCGKTLVARATAGECATPFLNLRIEDVLDPHYGVSEGKLHAAFSEARDLAPCVLFIDELDAFAYARRKQQGSGGRALVDQLLQELDAIGADNHALLVLAATNAPWDVDDALKRPGRFDRVVFVPPPDAPARRRILALLLANRPAANLTVDPLVNRTALCSGADLRSLVERAVDAVIDEALDRGDVDLPMTQRHLDGALTSLRATTVDWLRTARNYVEFANQGGRYDDVLAYLDRPEIRRLLRR